MCSYLDSVTRLMNKVSYYIYLIHKQLYFIIIRRYFVKNHAFLVVLFSYDFKIKCEKYRNSLVVIKTLVSLGKKYQVIQPILILIVNSEYKLSRNSKNFFCFCITATLHCHCYCDSDLITIFKELFVLYCY